MALWHLSQSQLCILELPNEILHLLRASRKVTVFLGTYTNHVSKSTPVGGSTGEVHQSKENKISRNSSGNYLPCFPLPWSEKQLSDGPLVLWGREEGRRSSGETLEVAHDPKLEMQENQELKKSHEGKRENRDQGPQKYESKQLGRKRMVLIRPF